VDFHHDRVLTPSLRIDVPLLAR